MVLQLKPRERCAATNPIHLPFRGAPWLMVRASWAILGKALPLEIAQSVANPIWGMPDYMPSHQALFNDPLKGSDQPDFDQVARVVVKTEIAAPAFIPERELGHEPEQLDMAVRYL